MADALLEDQKRLDKQRANWRQAADEYLSERSRDSLNPVAWLKMKAQAVPLWVTEHQPQFSAAEPTDKRAMALEQAQQMADMARASGKPLINPWAKMKPY